MGSSSSPWSSSRERPAPAAHGARQVHSRRSRGDDSPDLFALYAAHTVGVIHRDLKPQNIMRDVQGRTVVMDFGLARSVEADGMTNTGALVGTMEYMSPEQALGKELDQRSDIFALGLDSSSY